jgi:hypothetical protein
MKDTNICFGNFMHFNLLLVIQFLVIHQTGVVGMIGGPDLIPTAKPYLYPFMAVKRRTKTHKDRQLSRINMVR